MRLAPGLLVLGLVALLLAAAAPSPSPQAFGLRASAPVATIDLVSDRAVAGRGDGVNLTVWLNVTGGGQFQRTWVNLSLNTAAQPSQNSLFQGPLPWTQPAGCAYTVNSSWYLAWQCVGLRAGTYVWGIPTVVPVNASVGHGQRVQASAASAIGTGSVSASTNVTVWIAGALLRIVDVDSVPRDSVRSGDVVHYWINASNELPPFIDLNGTGTAYNVTVTVELDPGLQPGTGVSSLTTRFATLPAQAVLSVNLEAIVATGAAPGTSLGILVLIHYEDFNGHAIGPIRGESSPLYVVQATVLSPANLIAGAAIGLAAILTSLVVLLYTGQRKIVIDEAFLMTKGGILIRHVSRRPELTKDDDIVASMFVAIQEFVRDSFRREASLDSVAFGHRRAAVVRGELTILAAVISQGDPDSVAPELLAAVRAVEARYWEVLRSWDGTISRFEGVDAILERLMEGKFRAAWRVQLA